MGHENILSICQNSLLKDTSFNSDTKLSLFCNLEISIVFCVPSLAGPLCENHQTDEGMSKIVEYKLYRTFSMCYLFQEYGALFTF